MHAMAAPAHWGTSANTDRRSGADRGADRQIARRSSLCRSAAKNPTAAARSTRSDDLLARSELRNFKVAKTRRGSIRLLPSIVGSGGAFGLAIQNLPFWVVGREESFAAPD